MLDFDSTFWKLALTWNTDLDDDGNFLIDTNQ